MSELPKRSLEELFARYENEPGLTDVYAEGAFDRDLLGHAFQTANRRDVTVYEIDSVDVPADLVLSAGLTLGNKQAVITLANFLSKLPVDCSYKCLVDVDLDDWFQDRRSIVRLTYTKYADLESYFLSEPLLQELIVTVANAKITSFSVFWSSLIDVLRDARALRIADRELGLNLRWLDLEGSLAKQGSRIDFDRQDFMTRVLAANGKTAQRSSFNTSSMAWRAKLNADPRLECRGHDMVSVTAWAIRKFNGHREFATTKAIERLLVMLAPRQLELLELLAN